MTFALSTFAFDEAAYLNSLDAATKATIGAGKDFETGLDQYTAVGQFSGESGFLSFNGSTFEFVTDEYFDANKDVFDLIKATPGLSAVVHYDLFGVKEGRSPGTALFEAGVFALDDPTDDVLFDEATYLALNPDVAALVDPTGKTDGFFVSGLQHFVTFGKDEEGRAGTAFTITPNDPDGAKVGIPVAGIDPGPVAPAPTELTAINDAKGTLFVSGPNDSAGLLVLDPDLKDGDPIAVEVSTFVGGVFESVDVAPDDQTPVTTVDASGLTAGLSALGVALVGTFDGPLTLIGSPLPDKVAVSDGPITVDGGGGDDVITGFDGDDVLAGGPGDDTLDGSSGENTLTGGAGQDAFKLNPFGPATITDFTAGEDLLDLAFALGGSPTGFVTVPAGQGTTLTDGVVVALTDTSSTIDTPAEVLALFDGKTFELASDVDAGTQAVVVLFEPTLAETRLFAIETGGGDPASPDLDDVDDPDAAPAPSAPVDTSGLTLDEIKVLGVVENTLVAVTPGDVGA